jgi:hypothetical protein
MKVIENFGRRKGYHELHIAFIIKAKYRRRAGVNMEIFVEATLDSDGVRNISLRENGTNNILSLDLLDEKDKLYEIILNKTL